MQRKELVEKIRKLLRLSASSNEHEAAAAAAKAQELLSKYNLEIAAVELENEPMRAQRIHKKTRQSLEHWAYGLAHCTAEAFDCDYYHSRLSGETVFVGAGADPEICGWMFGYLYKTLLRLASAYMRSPACKRLRANKSKKSARMSFLIGAVSVIAGRLAAQKKAAPITPGALVVAKKALIKAAMPELTIKKGNAGELRNRDLEAGISSTPAVPLSTPVKGASVQPLLALN